MMHRFLCALALLAVPAAAPAGDEYGIAGLLDQQEVELDSPQEPQVSPDTPFLEYVIAHSELETGFLYIEYGDDLHLESDAAFYARWRVRLDDGFDVNATLRYADFTNSDLPGPVREEVNLVGGLVGAGYRREIVRDIDLALNGAAGIMRWESDLHGLRDETGLILSGEAAVVFRLYEGMRFKLGGVAEYVNTDFHDADSEVNVGALVAIEIGG